MSGLSFADELFITAFPTQFSDWSVPMKGPVIQILHCCYTSGGQAPSNTNVSRVFKPCEMTCIAVN